MIKHYSNTYSRTLTVPAYFNSRDFLACLFASSIFIAGWASLAVQLIKNPPAMQEIPVQFLGQEDPLEKG